MQILFEGGDGATKPEVFYNEDDKALIDITPVITNMEDVINPNSFNGFNLKSETASIDKIEINLNGLVSIVDYTQTLNITPTSGVENNLAITYISNKGIRSRTTEYSFNYINNKTYFYRFIVRTLGGTESGGNKHKGYLSNLKFYLDGKELYLYYLANKWGFAIFGTDASKHLIGGTINSSNNSANIDQYFSGYQDAYNKLGDNEVFFKINTNVLSYAYLDNISNGTATLSNGKNSYTTFLDVEIAKLPTAKFISQFSYTFTNDSFYYTQCLPYLEFGRFNPDGSGYTILHSYNVNRGNDSYTYTS